MKAKKIIIGVFAVVLAMQMTGCKNNIDTSKPVVIDVSVSENDIEEERRLFYVGMTRARKELSMLYAKERHEKRTEPSRFLTESGITEQEESA